jgi:hypothetical protein
VKILRVMMKDLRLMSRDRAGLVGTLAVPIVVIMVIAAATQSVGVTKNIVFPIVNEDQGPIATALINSLRKHLDVRIVSRADAIRMVRETHQAPAALILPSELSKRYLAQQPATIELLTDPAQWQQVGAVKMAMLVADHDAAAANDPLSQELLTVQEESLTGDSLSFSSLEQNIPGFSLMFVLLTLLFSVSLGLREEENYQHPSCDRAGVGGTAAGGQAAGALGHRHRTTADAVAVRSFRVRACAGQFTARNACYRDGNRRFDDVFCGRSGGIRAYPRAGGSGGTGSGVRAGLARWTVLAAANSTAVDATSRWRADNDMVNVRAPGRDAPRARPGWNIPRVAGAANLWLCFILDRAEALQVRRSAGCVIKLGTMG